MALSSKKDNFVMQAVANTSLPNMVKVKQIFDKTHIVAEEIPELVRQDFLSSPAAKRITPGMRVAITAGSRGIANIAIITKAIVDTVRELGGDPFVFPAMGSHGGATAEGQINVLSYYGITEAFLGCPILSSMEVVELGNTEEGLPVFADKHAMEADAIILCGRIKAHTAFEGPYESGILKMAVIGMGKQHGAETVHDSGFHNMARVLQQSAKVVLEKTKVIAGIGLIENAFNQTCQIETMDRDEILAREPELLQIAKERHGHIFFDNLDVLVVDEIGKNYSGDGMDPHVTGRFNDPSIVSGGLNARRVVVLDLSEETHGNANGIGLSDVTTKRVIDKFDADETYPNILTSTVTVVGKIPVFLHTDKAAVQFALKTSNCVDKDNPRMVRIANTAQIEEIFISEVLLEEARANSQVELLTEPTDWGFDKEDNLV